jgi:U3 small nucleolar RNA-associated protein 23
MAGLSSVRLLSEICCYLLCTALMDNLIVITQCSIRHLYFLPTSSNQSPSPSSAGGIAPDTKDALIDLAKTFERRRCNHHTLDNPLSTLECLASVIDPKSSGTNRYRYVLASQDEHVRHWARGVRGVPSVYVKRSVMVLEPMAGGSEAVKRDLEREKLRGGAKVSLGKRERDEEDREAAEPDEGGEEGAATDVKRKKSRGPRGPNPLSVKKKKRRALEPSGVRNEAFGGSAEIAATDGVKRKRRRKHGTGNLGGEGLETGVGDST